MKKVLLSALALVLVACCAVGATLAYLKDESETVTNTFTNSANINIKLDEAPLSDDGIHIDSSASSRVTANENYKLLPGQKLDKDPIVTVEEGSEACYLFIKVKKSDNFGNFLTYDMASEWTQLEIDGEAVDNVYYYNGNALDQLLASDVEIQVLKDDIVTVKSDVTSETFESWTNSDLFNNPTLEFKAFAVQKDNVADVEAAWETIEGVVNAF